MESQLSARSGNFIAFEGIDGSGKSTQLAYLKERLNRQAVPYYETREPTDSPIGSMIHQIMTGRIQTDNKVIAALFVADRLDHLLNDTDGLCDKINQGITVISDRYYFSSYAYQSVDIDMDWIIHANSVCADILRPACNIFIDVEPDEALNRIAKGRFRTELFETKERLTMVRKNYFEAFGKLKDREKIIVINGSQEPEKVAEDIWKEISYLFEPFLKEKK